jgi:ABC-type nitrate/sulfonate/bicarbonate transport system substrate-binding protein
VACPTNFFKRARQPDKDSIMHRIVLLVILGILVITVPAVAQPDDITVNYPTISGSSWPLFLAKEGGYYEKYGMNVELVFGVHPAGIAMIVSGEAQMTVYTLEQSMIASSRDGSLVFTGTPFKKSLFALMSNAEITSVADLRGRRIAVSQIGDAPYNYTSGILSKFGLSSRDVRWFPVGTNANGRASALAAGRVDATMLTAPAYYSLEELGFSSLANLHDYDDLYAPTVYLFTKRGIRENPDLPELMTKAHAEAIKRFYDDKAFAVDAYLAYDPQMERTDVERMYDGYREGNTFERIPYLPAAAVQYVLDNAADENLVTQMRGFDFNEVIDQSVVDRLIDEGFFEELFGDQISVEQDEKAALAFGK